MKFAVYPIVTYNRLELLKRMRTAGSCPRPFHFSYICIIDNHSTDGTSEYLDQLALRSQNASSAENGRNFSFSTFRKISAEQEGFAKGSGDLGKTDCDWILIIDDDAMIAADYIEQLQKAIFKRQTTWLIPAL